MGYIDQFVASVSFDTKKVIQFREQNAWKTILYLLVLVITTGAMGAFLRWESSLSSFFYPHDPLTVTADARILFAFVQYIMVFLDLILHFVMISVIAFAGSHGYRAIKAMTYREAWNVTAYGISAPILVRLVIQGMGFTLPMMTMIYWGAIMLFSLLCLKAIVNLGSV
ncbi:MAG: DUF1189 domain-containing protein [Turicibacter sp.]|nr:DUF1189 domain-containing protein [Turicibacter sp.]